MKKHGHQHHRHATPAAEIDLQHQGTIGGQNLAREAGRVSDENMSSSLNLSFEDDVTPGRDPAEGADVALTSPSHERWAQHTFDRDAAEGSTSAASPRTRR